MSANSSSAQRTRSQYLSALGIVQYRPKVERVIEDQAAHVAEEDQSAVKIAADVAVTSLDLVAAVNSAGVDKSDLARQQLTQLATDLESATVKPALKPTAGSGTSLDIRTDIRTDISTDISTEQTAELEPPSQLTFRLACWQVSNELLVLDSLAPGERPDARRVALLGNILKAIGQQPDLLPPSEFLDWPLSSGADSSLAGAKISIHTFLQGRLSQSPFRWVLAMGDAAIQCLSPENQGVSSDSNMENLASKRQRFPLLPGVTALCVPGLGDMLSDPSTKALTWKTLQLLNQASVTSASA